MKRVRGPLGLLLVFLTGSLAAQDAAPRSRNVGIVALVSDAAVHKELKLVDSQASALRMAAAESKQGLQSVQRVEPIQERRKQRSKINRALRSVIATTLNKAQRRRLLEIEIQWTSGAWIVARPVVAALLELTPEQRRSIRELAVQSRDRNEALRAARTQANRRQTQKKTVAVLVAARQAAVKLLTDEQQEKWKQAQGEPFALPRKPTAKKKSVTE